MSNNKLINDYSKWAGNYDSVDNPTRDLDQKVVQKLFPDLEGRSLLEAGCGTGKNTVYFAQHAKRILAFDITPEMLKKAKSKITKANVLFIEHNILERWPSENGEYDFVSINLVLEHIKDIEFIFHEAYRVLHEKGKLIICELHPEKQSLGSKARFNDADTNDTIVLESYPHSKDEYNSAAIKAGFQNIVINDWYDDIEKEIPRLISIIMEK